MILCFGTFVSVLNYCRQNILQTPLIAKIINIIDPASRYTGMNSINDAPAISKLLSCKINFIHSDGVTTKVPKQDEVIKRFENEIAPFMDEDKKAKIILTLLDIIRKDKSLDFDKKENFKKYIGLYKEELTRQTEFVFSDFLGKVLLYTICGNVENKAGQTCIKDITPDYINTISEPYVFEFQWSSDTQTLILSFENIFNIFSQALADYKIYEFIQYTDPTDRMNIDCNIHCEEFNTYIFNNIFVPFSPNTTAELGFTLTKVQEFAHTLDNYLKYLALNMLPINGTNTDIMVPRFRDENPPWGIDFTNNVNTYREQLISIYEKIYKHMLFANS